jgi:5-methylcytosine-specific restriction endonuclease McrA
VCNEKRAIVLLDRGKAEVLEHGDGVLHSPTQSIKRPSVIRLVYMIKRPRPKARLTRREVFIRDGYACQYCGARTKDLTIDHVVPRSRGGKHTWENLVSACRACNHRKGGKSPEDARMVLRRQPAQPRASSYFVFHQYLHTYVEWRKFIPEWELKDHPVARVESGAASS